MTPIVALPSCAARAAAMPVLYYDAPCRCAECLWPREKPATPAPRPRIKTTPVLHQKVRKTYGPYVTPWKWRRMNIPSTPPPPTTLACIGLSDGCECEVCLRFHAQVCRLRTNR